MSLIPKFTIAKGSKCHRCVQSKQPRKPHKAAEERNLAPLELIHSDLCEMNGVLTKGVAKQPRQSPLPWKQHEDARCEPAKREASLEAGAATRGEASNDPGAASSTTCTSSSRTGRRPGGGGVREEDDESKGTGQISEAGVAAAVA